jgi:hypothetical protein
MEHLASIGETGIKQGTFGIKQGTFGIVQCECHHEVLQDRLRMHITRGTFGVNQGTFGIL